MSDYTSTELFHFVGRGAPTDHEHNYIVLLKILRQGCISHPPHKNDWGEHTITYDPTKSLIDSTLIVPNMVCFCDIPKRSLRVHVKKYGPFGLSLSRAHLTMYGARPVQYFPYTKDDHFSVYGRTALKDIEAAVRSGNKQIAPLRVPKSRTLGKETTTIDETAAFLREIAEREYLAFTKSFDADLPEDHVDNYYMEREWRRLGSMKFEPQHVVSVIVPASFKTRFEQDAPELAAKLQTLEHCIGDCDGLY